MDENLMRDFIEILKEKQINASRDQEKGAFEMGIAFAYYDILDILNSELLAFGYDPKTMGLDKISLSPERRS